MPGEFVVARNPDPDSVSDRGRLRPHVLAAYAAAHPPSTTPD